MVIRKAQRNDFGKICVFNKSAFPEREIDCQQYLSFWLSKSSASMEDLLLVVNNQDEIVGQIIATTMSYYYRRKKTDTVWLFDLIIDEGLRKSAWGIDLLLKCMEVYPQSCSTGSGPKALPIHLKLGNSYLGEIRKYVGIVNPLFILNSFHRRVVPISQFPHEVASGQYHYYRISANELPSYECSFNPEHFEVGRERDFLKWRFFNQLHEYAFYLADDGGSYFVLRSVKIKGFRMMELVDFRCTISEKSIEIIFQAAKHIMRITHLAMMVCGSTLAVVDSILERHYFKCVGRPRPVLGFLKCKDRMEDIRKRNFCFVTFADSDGETNWI